LNLTLNKDRFEISSLRAEARPAGERASEAAAMAFADGDRRTRQSKVLSMQSHAHLQSHLSRAKLFTVCKNCQGGNKK
jgi:hypothetical protein